MRQTVMHKQHKSCETKFLFDNAVAEALTESSSRLYSPYSLRVPFPLVRIPQPLIMMVPDLMLVIVAGNSRLDGLCVVIPTSIEPDHLSTNRSNRI